MQYARLMKKAGIDLIKGRGDWKSNVSKIIYYGAIQNIIFNAMQQALFALAFDEEEEEKELQRQTRLANGMLDSILRGTGIYGAVVATGKNIATGVEAFTNVPVGRLYQKFNNVSEALKEENEKWQRIALMMGWNTWDVGIKQKKFNAGRSKSRSKSKSKSRSKPRN